jgi:peptide deformylase
MAWIMRHDRDAFKEVWLLFENDEGKFPLYPGESAEIEYGYTVGDDKWGHWFQRAVRLPTRRLSVELEFPTSLEPALWGTETSLAAASMALRTAPTKLVEGERTVFAWSTEEPPLHARYRMEWAFRARKDERITPSVEEARKPSETMASLGVVQEGDPRLRDVAVPFELPAEGVEAERVMGELHEAMARIGAVHQFSKGMGLAAPQIGINRAAALVRTSGGGLMALLNPRVIDESADSDEQYEGCLSFFDVRGCVPRPVRIDVAHQAPDGSKRITVFERGDARLVAHEIDHLNGQLYRDKMRKGVDPIPVSEYKGTGTTWHY